MNGFQSYKTNASVNIAVSVARFAVSVVAALRITAVFSKAVFGNKRAAFIAIAMCTSLFGGKAHAEFLMQSLEGERVDLHDYLGNGQWTLVMLWTTNCIPCEEQKPMIEEFHNTYKDSSAQVIGLALDGPAKQVEIDQLIAHHQPSYINLVAFDDVFARQFKEETGKPYSVTPTYVFYRPDGTLLGVHAGKVSRQALDAVVKQ